EDPGDEIILGNPHYPCYPNFVRYMRGVPKFIFTREEDGFQLKPEAVEELIGPRTRAILINSPSNPTGTLIPRDDIEAICNLGVPVISDEIYHGLVYGEKEHSTLEFTDNTFVLNGFSKLFAMTGWRLGYVIFPRNSGRTLHVLQQNFFISPNSFVQRGGITALTHEHAEIGEMVEKYDARRRYLLEELPRLGLKFAVEPKGAFYFFVNTEHIDGDSYRLAFDILENAGVAFTPGIDFGSGGEGYIRISYANSLENITLGIRKLENYLKARGAL
ncbi:MAG: aminotransferase class I/II-fold pyridoxal phosphate-dependent enzyme, partial [Candidatus Krumholzibacteria bacterium]|nr:aminotransferase class I/II-fold pyridoxal phosphate-dependent enzyme [Candidatus Krumholzibacteria bacterium]